MDFLHFDLGQQPDGAVAEITLSGNAANVLLLDSVNLQNYKTGRRYSYHGGHATRSPIRIAVPHAGHWHVVVDTGGHPGRVKASVRVLPLAV